MVCFEVDNYALICPELIYHTRKKYYVDNRIRDLEFEVGYRVCLNISHMKDVMRLHKKGKLSPRYVGPIQNIEMCWESGI